jgi:glycerol-3-phosphate acyltransferase PlsX
MGFGLEQKIMSIKLAIDVMGGDNAPEMIIAGVAISQRQYPNVLFLLYGDKAQISPLIAKHKLDASRLTVIHTDEVVTSDMQPIAALRGSKTSSMR